MTPREHLRSFLRTARHGSAPLSGVAVLLSVAFVAAVAGVLIDPRLITGVPAWLKPAKFAISTAIYSITLAWILAQLAEWPRLRRVAGWTTAVVFVLEVSIISAQAWRGTASHFNVATPVDAALFAVTGVAIVVQTIVSVAVAAALWRRRFSDAALGWALRLGMTLTIIGAITGGLMTRPTAEQLAAAEGGRIVVAGAHTVGGPDGGPGIPGTGWSLQHGDLRIPHFLGLHAMQALPLLAFALGRRRHFNAMQRARAVVAAGASYATLFALLLWQALRGQALVQPDGLTLAAFVAWLLATLMALRAAAAHSPALARRATALTV